MAAAKLGGAFVRIAAWTFMRSRAELAREPREKRGPPDPQTCRRASRSERAVGSFAPWTAYFLTNSAEIRFIARRVRGVAAGAAAGGRGDASRPGRRLLL